jgi:molybdopterin converting factor small subunit
VYYSSVTTATDTSIEVFLPGPLRDYCGGASKVRVSATTVKSALEELKRNQPTLYPNICDETGAVRKHIGVFVNSDHIRDLNGLDSFLEPGDALTILPAVSGG